MNKTKRISVLMLIYIATLFSLLLSSCSKVPINYNTMGPTTSVSITQASPDIAPIDIIIDNTKINQTTVNYGETSAYISLTTGKSAVVFYNDVTAAQILADTINFIQNKSYSLFLVNAATKPSVFLLTDTLSKPTAGNAAIRFINLSPDAPAADLVIKGGAVLVSNRAYEGYSSFAPIPGNAGYIFEVHQAGTGTVLATSTMVNLGAGFLYTIWFHGLAAGTTTSDKLSIDIINNADFF